MCIVVYIWVPCYFTKKITLNLRSLSEILWYKIYRQTSNSLWRPVKLCEQWTFQNGTVAQGIALPSRSYPSPLSRPDRGPCVPPREHTRTPQRTLWHHIRLLVWTPRRYRSLVCVLCCLRSKCCSHCQSKHKLNLCTSSHFAPTISFIDEYRKA